MTATSKSPHGRENCASLPPAAPFARTNTQPALDLDALLGGLPSGAERTRRRQTQRGQQRDHRAVARQRRPLSDLLSNTGSFTQTLAQRDQLIGEVIDQPQYRARPPSDGKSTELNDEHRPVAAADLHAERRPRSDRRRARSRWRRPNRISPICWPRAGGPCRASSRTPATGQPRSMTARKTSTR